MRCTPIFMDAPSHSPADMPPQAEFDHIITTFESILAENWFSKGRITDLTHLFLLFLREQVSQLDIEAATNQNPQIKALLSLILEGGPLEEPSQETRSQPGIPFPIYLWAS